jgi:lyso-ornithine lipid O-acyltransferase
MTAGGSLKRLARVFLYLGLTLPLMLLQLVLLALKSSLAGRLPVFYHGLCCRILGIRLQRHGRASTARPTLFVANHTSYLDIEILGAVVEGSFVAKTEVGTWPFFGWLAKLQRSVFIDRRSSRSHHHRDAIRDRLAAGDNLILFPEGTSHDGITVKPFKSALFSVADLAPADVPIAVQPISVAYVRLDGMPLGRFYRPFFAWYGDMDLGPHLWAMLALGDLDVVIIFHPPVTLDAFGSRKALAEHCHRLVAGGVAAALAGRLPPAEAPAAALAAEAVPAEAAP